MNLKIVKPFKVIIIGEPYVGKTSINEAYFDIYNMNYKCTLGIDFRIKTIVKKQTEFRFQVWDTAGQERFRAISMTYFNKLSGIILVYDITKKETFERIKFWLTQALKINSAFNALLIGNKTDLDKERQISYEEGKSFAEENGMIFYETSLYKPETIKTAFNDLFDEIIAVSYSEE